MKREVLASATLGLVVLSVAPTRGVAEQLAPTAPTAPTAPMPTADVMAAPHTGEPAATRAPVPDVASRAATPDAMPTPARQGFSWRLAGVLRVASTVVQNDPNVQFIGRSDGFEVQDARIGLSGRYGERIGVELSINGSLDSRERANTPNGELRVGLVDAFADIALGKDLTGLSLRLGRFLTSADPDQMSQDPVAQITGRAFVDRSLMSRGVRATEGWETEGLAPTRSHGAALRLDPGHVESGAKLGFEVAAQNGANDVVTANDNDAFALSVSGFVRLPHNSFVLAFGRWNPRTIGELPLRQDQTDLDAAVSGLVHVGPVELAGGLMLRNTTFETTGGPSQLAIGGHGQAMYSIPTELPLAVGYRFGILDPSNLVLTDRVMEHTVGMIMRLTAVRSRVLLNFTHVAEQAERKLANDRVEAVFEVAL